MWRRCCLALLAVLAACGSSVPDGAGRAAAPDAARSASAAVALATVAAPIGAPARALLAAGSSSGPASGPSSAPPPFAGDAGVELHVHPHPHAHAIGLSPPGAGAGAGQGENQAVMQAVFHPGTGDPNVCTCRAARVVNGWCELHAVGFVAGVRVRYRLLFETLDPHGHDLDPATVTCPRCREAIGSDGWCDECHIGWQQGMAYMTRLTWLLAKGESVTASTPLCSSCRVASTAPGAVEPRWCDACGAGLVGDVRFTDRPVFDEASDAFQVLRRALERAKACELCACAIVYDRTCPDCRITYRHGVAVAEPAASPPQQHQQPASRPASTTGSEP